MTTLWSEGYVSEIEYTRGYYPELSPLRAQFALTLAGFVAPVIANACELGYGQGASLNLHAAGGAPAWWGTDFNPSQAVYAQETALAGGTGRVHLEDQGFEEYCRREDLPMFDYIGLHGIYSWISEKNRKAIVHLISRRLKAGGVVYISYNTMPGWAAFAPLRDLMKLHADSMSAPALGVTQRMDAAMQFATRLLDTNPLYSQVNSSVAVRFEKLKTMDRSYLVHEYLNSNWNPLRFDACAAELGEAKLNYACPAALLEHVDALNLTADQQKLLAEISEPVVRETVRDYCLNQQFRRDYWIKGARRHTAIERAYALRQLRMILTTPPARVRYTVTGALGNAELQQAIYQPVIELMSDHRPRTLGELEQHFAAGKGPNLAQLAQMAAILVGSATMQVAQPDGAIAAARETATALNKHLLQKASLGDASGALASPVTAGGVMVPLVSQLFLLASLRGARQAQELAQFAWETLSRTGQRLLREGKLLETAEDSLAKLREDADKFLVEELPILKGLALL